MRRFAPLLILLIMVSCTQEQDPVESLLSQMTLEEKCGQLSCPIGFDFYGKDGDSLWLSDDFLSRMDTMPLGSCWAVLRADPWSKKTVETGLHPKESAKLLNMMQRHAVENTRLGIPLLFCEETPHGHMAVGTTVFPTGIGQASTWDPVLLEQMGEVMGKEVRLQGAQIGYGPVLDIARDPRWSRVEETFGEDPYLSGVLGAAVVKGMQKHACATLKHLAAYGIPQGGHNAATADVGPNRMITDYLPSFEKAICEGGAKTVMTSYNTIDGVPCSANAWLLQEVLRNSWNFKGVVFSDLNAVNAIYATQHEAADPAEAAALALKAGVDIDLGGYNYGGFLKEALQRGLVSEADIDRAVRHVLQLKYDLGLFDNPYVDEALVEAEVGTSESAQVAKQVALESAVLLKNDGILPFGAHINKVAVIGPNADNMYNQLGDYTAPQPPDRIVTLLEGIREKGRAEVLYAKGCAVRDENDADIEAAVKIAQQADVVVLVVGGSSARDFKTSYEDTGAAIVDEHVSDMDCGEGYDRSTLKLLGKQEELMQRIYATGKPVVTVYIQGRPMDMNLANEKSNALLTMWYPGMEGGSALADILWGDYNPAGRLPISVPRSVGQIPVYYSQPQMGDYVEESAQPMFPFGYGLSYTQFEYSDLQVETLSTMSSQQGSVGKGGSMADTLCKVTCTVKNIGPCDGDEVVQLYVRDEVASIAPASNLLKGFQRVHINKGVAQQVFFYLAKRDLALYSVAEGWRFEPGAFTFMVGGSSDNLLFVTSRCE
ncbi:MAG: glycoside hydrolase family 3 C-terminal domain-containing protein [Bacteroidales bacterium]|nr:glycoside hydrolase family 3 C-terminal domain-containing protein [Bacteroidales bacterium]